MAKCRCLRALKGRVVLAEQRLIELFDDSRISIAQDLGRSYDTNAPRWLFLR